MDIRNLVSAEAVVDRLTVSSKKQLLQNLSKKGEVLTGVPERTVFNILLKRERLGSTGMGSGIAIPHGKLPELPQMVGLFARLSKPVDFDAIDDQPVDLVFLLLVPETARTDHLKALASVSRLLRREDICAKLRGAENRDALYALLTQNDSKP